MISCNNCDCEFKNKTKLMRHTKTDICHIGQCKTCRFGIVDKPIKIIKKSVSVTCAKCKRVFKNGTGLHNHAKSGTCGVNKCKKCSSNFKTVQGLLKHQTTCKKNMKVTCPKCNRVFKNGAGLLCHVKGGICGINKCKRCKCEFDTVQELSKHKKTCKKCVNVSCEKCKRVFKDKAGLACHMKSGTCGINKCQRCKCEFGSVQELLKHCEVCKKGVSVSCDKCKKVFKNKAGLHNHVKSGTCGKNKCKKCKCEFGNEHDLLEHGEKCKKDVCVSCEKCKKVGKE